LRAGKINHALTLAVPCTRDEFVYPANHKAVAAYCSQMGPNPNWPAMGQLFWLDVDESQIKADPTSQNAPAWAQTIMAAMHHYGMYVNDNGGYQSSFFQVQTEAQAQYTSLGADDPWLAFAKSNWTQGSNQDYVGLLQGNPPQDPAQRSAFYVNWRTFWQQHLHVLADCQLPGQSCIN
jgi:hypothetical protein